jgi:glutamate racemase
MLEAGIDTLIMGCTHYPLLAPLLAQVAGPGVELISSAEETAAEVDTILDRLGWLAEGDRPGSMMFLTTGDVDEGRRLGRMFLGPEVREVIPITFDKHPAPAFLDAEGEVS